MLRSGKSRNFWKIFLLSFIAFSLLAIPSFAIGNSEDAGAPEPTLIVWTYDSFASEWGPAKAIADAFRAENGIRVHFVSRGDGGELLSRLLIEGKKAEADIVLGLDQNLLPKALESGLFLAYRSPLSTSLPEFLVMDAEYRLSPFDYGYFAIIYDSEKITEPPKSLEDLCRAEFKKKLILMDPRSSTPGLGFLAWTKSIYGPAWLDYWKRLAPSILVVADGWDSGYGMFSSGEAPLVLSYTTSPAYHKEFEETERYKAAIFSQGHPLQIEGAGILKSSQNRENAKKFIDFMLSPAFQSIIPLSNWMYPVQEIALPASFSMAPKSPINLKGQAISDADLSAWAALLSKR
ncbi:thiamine ABC transporter substrate binding subunit [Treponema sp.]